MIPYIIFFAFAFALNNKVNKDSRKYDARDFALLLMMIIFSAMRLNIGIDYKLYYNTFYVLTPESFMNLETNRTGLGFTLLMYAIKSILNGSYHIVIGIVAILTNVLMYNFFKRNCKRPRLAILIYIGLGFYTSSFNIFRQMLAIAFVLNAMDYLKLKKYITSVIMFVLGVACHSTSILIIALMIFIYFLRKEIKPSFVFVPAVIGVVVYDLFFDIIVSNISSLSIYAYTDQYKPGIGTILNVIVYIFLYYMFVYKCKNKLGNSSKMIIYKNYCLVGTGIMLFALENHLVVRFATYFLVYFPILISESFEIYKFNKSKENSFIFYACLFMYYLIYAYSFGGVVPYQSILEGVII